MLAKLDKGSLKPNDNYLNLVSGNSKIYKKNLQLVNLRTSEKQNMLASLHKNI